MQDAIENLFFGAPKSGTDLPAPYWALGGPNSRDLRTPTCVLALLSDYENDRNRVQNLQEVIGIICQGRIQPAPTPDEVVAIRKGIEEASDLIFFVSPEIMHQQIKFWFGCVSHLADPAATGPFEEWTSLGFENFTEDKPRYWVLCGRALHALVEMLRAICDGMTFLKESGVDIAPFAKTYESQTRPQSGRQAGNC